MSVNSGMEFILFCVLQFINPEKVFIQLIDNCTFRATRGRLRFHLNSHIDPHFRFESLVISNDTSASGSELNPDDPDVSDYVDDDDGEDDDEGEDDDDDDPLQIDEGLNDH